MSPKSFLRNSANNGLLTFLYCSIATTIAVGLLVSAPEKVTGHTQKPQSTQQSAKLQEAERLNKRALQLLREGKYTEGIPFAQRALAIREKVLGKEHPQTAQSLSALVLLYAFQENYSKAEPLYVRMLSINEKVMGKEHPNNALILNGLAEL